MKRGNWLKHIEVQFKKCSDPQDRLYEIDRSWQNNLIFYGIRPDHLGNGTTGGGQVNGAAPSSCQVVYESQDCIEQKIKACIRNVLNIGREIPIQRAQRIYNGADVRGFKPVVVNFQVHEQIICVICGGFKKTSIFFPEMVGQRRGA